MPSPSGKGRASLRSARADVRNFSPPARVNITICGGSADPPLKTGRLFRKGG